MHVTGLRDSVALGSAAPSAVKHSTLQVFILDFTLCTLPGSMGLLCLLSLLPLAFACEAGACEASQTAALLSFKAELAR